MLGRDALQLLSEFPTFDAATPSFAAFLETLRPILTAFARRWDLVVTSCSKRGFPPSCREFMDDFKLRSYTLQRVMYSAIDSTLHDRDLPQAPAMRAHSLALFVRYQQRSSMRRQRSNNEGEELLAFGTEYMNLKAKTLQPYSSAAMMGPRSATAQPSLVATELQRQDLSPMNASVGATTAQTPGNPFASVISSNDRSAISTRSDNMSHTGRPLPVTTTMPYAGIVEVSAINAYPVGSESTTPIRWSPFATIPPPVVSGWITLTKSQSGASSPSTPKSLPASRTSASPYPDI